MPSKRNCAAGISTQATVRSLATRLPGAAERFPRLDRDVRPGYLEIDDEPAGERLDPARHQRGEALPVGLALRGHAHQPRGREAAQLRARLAGGEEARPHAVAVGVHAEEEATGLDRDEMGARARRLTLFERHREDLDPAGFDEVDGVGIGEHEGPVGDHDLGFALVLEALRLLDVAHDLGDVGDGDRPIDRSERRVRRDRSQLGLVDHGLRRGCRRRRPLDDDLELGRSEAEPSAVAEQPFADPLRADENAVGAAVVGHQRALLAQGDARVAARHRGIRHRQRAVR